MKKTCLSILSLSVALLFSSCYSDNFKELHPVSLKACDTSNTVTYSADIKAIVDGNCVSCHKTGGTQPYLDNYADISSYSSDKLLGVLAPSAAKPMPPSSPLGQADIDKIKQWVNGCRPYGAIIHTACDTTSAPMSYSLDIAPILSANCTNGCHDHVGLGHSLLTLADVQNDTFLIYKNYSYLVFSLIDTVPSKRMPLGRPNLSACQIAKIRKWVEAGNLNP